MKIGLKMMCRELGKGDFLAFSYNGKNREGTVVKRFDDALCLETVDGPRSFTYSKIRPTLDTVLDSGVNIFNNGLTSSQHHRLP